MHYWLERDQRRDSTTSYRHFHLQRRCCCCKISVLSQADTRNTLAFCNYHTHLLEKLWNEHAVIVTVEELSFTCSLRETKKQRIWLAIRAAGLR